MSRYTPPSAHRGEPSSFSRRPRSIRIGVWILLIGVVALVFSNLIAALL